MIIGLFLPTVLSTTPAQIPLITGTLLDVVRSPPTTTNNNKSKENLIPSVAIISSSILLPQFDIFIYIKSILCTLHSISSATVWFGAPSRWSSSVNRLSMVRACCLTTAPCPVPKLSRDRRCFCAGCSSSGRVRGVFLPASSQCAGSMMCFCLVARSTQQPQKLLINV